MEETKKHYIKKADFTEELTIYRDTKVITEKLHLIFLDIAKRLINKRTSEFNFSGYTKEYKEDMIQSAYMRCITYGLKAYSVDKEKSPLAYFTQTIKNDFKAFVKKEKLYQNRKWNELSNHISFMETTHHIKLEMNNSIKEKIYKAGSSTEFLEDCMMATKDEEEKDNENISPS